MQKYIKSTWSVNGKILRVHHSEGEIDQPIVVEHNSLFHEEGDQYYFNIFGMIVPADRDAILIERHVQEEPIESRFDKRMEENHEIWKNSH